MPESCERCHASHTELGIRKDSDPHKATCHYCYVAVPCTSNPQSNEEWAEVAKLHSTGCEWVKTKAHTE